MSQGSTLNTNRAGVSNGVKGFAPFVRRWDGCVAVTNFRGAGVVLI